MLNVLLTGAGAPGTWGTARALRDNPSATKVRIVGTDVRRDSVGRYILDGYHQIKRPADNGYLEQLLAVCGSEGIKVIVPQTSAETLFLSKKRLEIENAGFRLLSPPHSAVATAEDKHRLYELCDSIGVPAPITRLVHSVEELRAAAAQLGYPGHPVAVKPPVSNGMRGFRVLKEHAWTTERFFAEKPSADEISMDELTRIFGGDHFRPLLVSEYLSGNEYSVDMCTLQGREVVVPRRRTEIRSGISFVTDVEYRHDLVDASIRIARALGLTGVFGFQFRESAAGIAKILESNPRIQGTMVASLVSGYNIIWAGVCDAMQWPVPEPGKLSSGRFSRYWGGVGVGSHGGIVVR